MYEVFKCSCGEHILEINHFKDKGENPVDDISFTIYDIYNPETGRKYIKPKIIGEAVLMPCNATPTDLKRFIKFITKIADNISSPNWKRTGKKEDYEIALDNAVDKVKEMIKEREKKNRELSKKNKAKRKK